MQRFISQRWPSRNWRRQALAASPQLAAPFKGRGTLGCPLRDLPLAGHPGDNVWGLVGGRSTPRSESRTDDLSAQEPTVPGAPPFLAALSVNLLLSVLGLEE
jgi:hypothetical protein